MAIDKRWVILEHTGSPNDPMGSHFDLLLENGSSCRTWRLAAIPILDGPAIDAVLLTDHKIDWLTKINAPVSGDRGWARRIFAGFFTGDLPINSEHTILVELKSNDFVGMLQIQNNSCKLVSNIA